MNPLFVFTSHPTAIAIFPLKVHAFGNNVRSRIRLEFRSNWLQTSFNDIFSLCRIDGGPSTLALRPFLQLDRKSLFILAPSSPPFEEERSPPFADSGAPSIAIPLTRFSRKERRSLSRRKFFRASHLFIYEEPRKTPATRRIPPLLTGSIIHTSFSALKCRSPRCDFQRYRSIMPSCVKPWPMAIAVGWWFNISLLLFGARARDVLSTLRKPAGGLNPVRQQFPADSRNKSSSAGQYDFREIISRTMTKGVLLLGKLVCVFTPPARKRA